MTEFLIAKEIINVKFSESESFQVRVPSVGESKHYASQIAEADPAAVVGVVQQALCDLGLPLEFQEENMSLDNIFDLWRVVNGDKKK